MGGVVPIAANAHRDGVLRGDVLGVDLNESTGEVGRIFGTWRLDNHEVVNLTARDDVEGEGARVGLGTWYGTTVDPYIIISLGKSAHHHKLILDEAHTRYATDDLAGIVILSAANLLCRDVAHHLVAQLGSLNHCHVGVLACHTRHLNLAEHLLVALHFNLKRFGGGGVGSGSLESECLVTYILNNNSLVTLFQSLEFKLAVDVGGASLFAHHHCGTNECLACLLVNHYTFYISSKGREASGNQQHHSCKKSFCRVHLLFCLCFRLQRYGGYVTYPCQPCYQYATSVLLIGYSLY